MINNFFHFDDHKGIPVEVIPNQRMILDLLQAEQNFWNCIQKKTPPPLEDRDYQILKDKKAVGVFQKLKNAKTLFDQAKADYDGLKESALSFCRHPRVLCDGVKVITYEKKGAVQYGSIPELKNIDLEAYRKKASLVTSIRFPDEA